MEHVVFFPSPEGVPAFRRFGSVDDAVLFVETLRNVDGVSDFSVHSLTPVPLTVRQYFRVEVPSETDPAPAAAVVAGPPVVDVPVQESPVQESAVQGSAVQESPAEAVRPEPAAAAQPVAEPAAEPAVDPVVSFPAPDFPDVPVAAETILAGAHGHHSGAADGDSSANGKRGLGFFNR